MPEPWIKLIIHPEHPKVLRLAELLRLHPDEVFAKAVRWFRYVDANLASSACAIGSASLCAICRFHPDRNKSQTEDTLVEAMVAVGWLGRGEAGGPLQVLEFEKHFGKNAKIRAQAADRQKALRDKRNESNAGSVTSNGGSVTPSSLSLDRDLGLSQNLVALSTADSARAPRLCRNDEDDTPVLLLQAVNSYCDAMGINRQNQRTKILRDSKALADPAECGIETVLASLAWGQANLKEWCTVASRIRNTAVTAGWVDKAKGNDDVARVKAEPGKYARFKRTPG